MPIFELSIEARNDLTLIWLYISDQSNDEIADCFIDNLEEACSKISKMPNIGNSQGHICEGLRKHPYKNYSIYYDIVGQNHIVIRRFWHQSRDLDNLLIQ
jgi:plasmid stabilization system protein ParE